MEMLRNKKASVEQNLAVAQNSTASMGRFDKKTHKEERKLKVKRRKEYRNFSNVGEEVERNKDILSMVLRAEGSKKLTHSL